MQGLRYAARAAARPCCLRLRAGGCTKEKLRVAIRLCKHPVDMAAFNLAAASSYLASEDVSRCLSRRRPPLQSDP